MKISDILVFCFYAIVLVAFLVDVVIRIVKAIKEAKQKHVAKITLRKETEKKELEVKLFDLVKANPELRAKLLGESK